MGGPPRMRVGLSSFIPLYLRTLDKGQLSTGYTTPEPLLSFYLAPQAVGRLPSLSLRRLAGWIWDCMIVFCWPMSTWVLGMILDFYRALLNNGMNRGL